MKVIYTGVLANVGETSYKNKETGVVNVSKKFQFNEKGDNGMLSMLDIKLADNEEIKKYEAAVGKEVSITIFVKLVNGKLFFNQVSETKITIRHLAKLICIPQQNHGQS